MSIFFEILVRIARYGLQIGQSHGENRLSHMIRNNIHQAQNVAQTLDSTIHQIKHYPGDKYWGKRLYYPVDSAIHLLNN